MAKQILQSIGRNHGIETVLPCLEAGDRPGFPAKVMRLINNLAIYFHRRERRENVEPYIPRETYDRESRLEFDRFIHW